MDVISKNLLLLRKFTGYNQEEFAGVSSLTGSLVSQRENGKKALSAEEIMRLEDIFRLKRGRLLHANILEDLRECVKGK